MGSCKEVLRHQGWLQEEMGQRVPKEDIMEVMKAIVAAQRDHGNRDVRANARMTLRVLGTLLGRRDDSQFYRASREEARFREAEWDNYLHHGPRGQSDYHHGFEHCI